MKSLNRRQFLQTTAASTIGAAFLSQLACSSGAGSAPFYANGGLAGHALLDDCAALAIKSNFVSNKVIHFIDANFNEQIGANASRVGMLLNTSSENVAGVIKKELKNIGDYWNGLSAEEQQSAKADIRSSAAKGMAVFERKIAVLCGWAMSDGYRKYLQPLYTKINHLPNDIEISHDMIILKTKAGLDLAGADPQVIQSLFLGIIPRFITRTHTLTPDYDDGMNWVNRISQWRGDTEILMQKYAEKLVSVSDDKSFYDSNEPLIKLSQAEKIDIKEMKTAMNNAKCLYAKSIAAGLLKLKEIEKYFA